MILVIPHIFIYIIYIKIKRGTNHGHKTRRQTREHTPKRGGSLLNYLDQTQTMARKILDVSLVCLKKVLE